MNKTLVITGLYGFPFRHYLYGVRIVRRPVAHHHMAKVVVIRQVEVDGWRHNKHVLDVVRIFYFQFEQLLKGNALVFNGF